MHDHTTHIRKAAAAVLTLVLAALALAACGGASKGTSSQTSPATAPATAPTTASASSPTPLPSVSAATKRYEALRSCMASNGIHVPKPQPGKPKTGSAIGTPPPGVSAARYEAVLQKCGFGGRIAAPGQVSGQAIRTALQRYADCMRGQGFEIPQLGATGTTTTARPIDTHSAKFKAAAAKCAPVARGALGTAP